MQTFYQVLGFIGILLIAWILYRGVKGRPELFSRENISKSFSSMGFLAIILIVFVWLLVLLVRSS
ncbi:MAG: hypothetical protein P1U74_10610 [Legionellaceae bacterium]|nr:hypothetical protein [Legionellaceae bacterium]